MLCPKKNEIESLQKKTKRQKTSPPTQNPMMHPNWILKQKKPRKKTKPASYALLQFKSVPRVYFKTTIKDVNRGQNVNKNSIPAYDALPWTRTPITMEDLPIHPAIGEIWRCLFDKDKQTPLQKLMATVNAGNPRTKKKKELMNKTKKSARI
jgi:hypothetical protein